MFKVEIVNRLQLPERGSAHAYVRVGRRVGGCGGPGGGGWAPAPVAQLAVDGGGGREQAGSALLAHGLPAARPLREHA